MYHIKIFSTTTNNLKHSIQDVSPHQYNEITTFITTHFGNSMYSMTYEGLTPFIIDVTDQDMGVNLFCKHINQQTYDIIVTFLLGEHSTQVGGKSKVLGFQGGHP